MTHKSVSLAKSAVRLAACVAGIWSFALFCAGFALAELLGILEELADKRPETPTRVQPKPARKRSQKQVTDGMQCHCTVAQCVPHTIGEHEACFSTRHPAVR